MADLIKEYTDIRNMKHKVEHLTVLTEEENGRRGFLKSCFMHCRKRAGVKPA